MPKHQLDSRDDRAQNASTPYQRPEPRANRDIDTQQETNTCTLPILSLSEAILAQISAPLAAKHESPAEHAVGQTTSTRTETPRSGRSGRRPPGTIPLASSTPDAAEENNEFQVKHAKYWQKCAPLKRRVYASMIVDIENINDKTGQPSSSLTPKPIKYRTLCFLTKRPIPIDSAMDALPIFNPPLPYLLAPRYSFKCRPGPPVDLTNSTDFNKIRQYTLNLMKIMAKQATFELSKSEMAYLILPISHNNAETGPDQTPETSIAWEEVDAFAAAEGRMLERQELADEIRLKALVDDGLFGYYHTESSTRFQVVGVRRDLCPSSVLEAVNSSDGSNGTIMSVQPRKWRDAFAARMEDVWEDQPIFEVETAYELSLGTRPVSSLRSRYVVPQLIQICNVSLSTYHSLYALPAFLQGLDHVLVANEFIKAYRLQGMSIPLALQAITLPSAGTGTTYQLLEWFGDSICGLVAAIYGYYLQTRHHCSIKQINALKRAIVENKDLNLAAKRSGMAEYLRAEGVSWKAWIPVSLEEGPGRAHCFKRTTFRIGVKGAADIVESVIGAYALSHGIDHIFPTFINLGFEFGIPVDFETLSQLELPDLTSYSTASGFGDQAASFARLASYKFANQALFTFAITLPTNPTFLETPFEQVLLRLGIAVYHHLLVEWMYAKYPDRTEGWLSEAIEIIINTIMQIGPDRMFGGRAQTSGRKKLATLRQKLGNKEAQAIEGDLASPIENAFKLVLACAFIDSGWSWERGPRKIFEHSCAAYLSSVRLPDLHSLHPRQELEKRLREKNCTGLKVEKIKPLSPGTCKITWHGKRIGFAQRDTMNAAVHAASTEALTWYMDPQLKNRRKSLCTCVPKETKEPRSDPRQRPYSKKIKPA
ncbi:hypothetical protein QFC21_003408 [Naganishia friedmannii]|uniref:Uncharacterized protein n=1 Tax=Naganishia friedmannii TaxID=89922 RepID=A0ACC2VQ91_9TREE|nr:hypothetical protein QFC21_003408 [Naganishia friedmannii]